MSISSNELDPLFLKAIALLRSSNPDSARQLKELVNDYRVKNFGASTNNKKVVVSSVSTIDQKLFKNDKNSKILTPENARNASPITVVENVEKISCYIEETSNSNVEEIEEIEEVMSGSSLEPQAKKRRGSSSENASSMSPQSDGGINETISIDDIIEMDFDEPMCVTCHLSKRSDDENLLVECTECNLQYHQKCHKPPVSTKELNDPRFLWYCSKCTRKLKNEMAAQQSTNTSKTSIESSPIQPHQAQSKPNPFQQAKPFRRNISLNDSHKNSNSSIISDSNIATTTESIIGSSSSREGSPVSKTKIRTEHQLNSNPMKRLEMVKKRAAKQLKKGGK